MISRCGSDADSDGYDNAIDCSPHTPTTNLFVTDPTGYQLWYGNTAAGADDSSTVTPVSAATRDVRASGTGRSPTGGQLDRDDNVGQCGYDPSPAVWRTSTGRRERHRHTARTLSGSTSTARAGRPRTGPRRGESMVSSSSGSSGIVSFAY